MKATEQYFYLVLFVFHCFENQNFSFSSFILHNPEMIQWVLFPPFRHHAELCTCYGSTYWLLGYLHNLTRQKWIQRNKRKWKEK